MPEVLMPYDRPDQALIRADDRPLRADEHPALVYLSKLDARTSRRSMRVALDGMVGAFTDEQFDHRSFPWHRLRYQHTAALRSLLAERFAPSTVNKMLSGLRGVLKEAWRLGLLTPEEYRRAVDIQNIKASTLPRGRALTAGEIAALMAVCAADPSPAGPRDAALIALMYGGLMRRSEPVGLDVEQYDPENHSLIIRQGKGRKDRITYVESGAAAALADWLAARGTTPGPLFCPVNKGGKVEVARMTDQAVYDAMAKRGKEAGVENFSPHDFRRTGISDLLDAGADIVTVQKLAGHASVETTARYDRRGEAAKKKAASLLHVPYRRRKEGD